MNREDWLCTKNERSDFSFFGYMPKKDIFEKQNQVLTILLASLFVFTCFYLKFQQAWLQWSRGG